MLVSLLVILSMLLMPCNPGTLFQFGLTLLFEIIICLNLSRCLFGLLTHRVAKWGRSFLRRGCPVPPSLPRSFVYD